MPGHGFNNNCGFLLFRQV